MKRVIAGVMVIGLLGGCSQVSGTSLKKVSGSYYTDTRTGCLYGKKVDSIFPVSDASGKQVGCERSGAMSVNEYLKLKK